MKLLLTCLWLCLVLLIAPAAKANHPPQQDPIEKKARKKALRQERKMGKGKKMKEDRKKERKSGEYPQKGETNPENDKE